MLKCIQLKKLIKILVLKKEGGRTFLKIKKLVYIHKLENCQNMNHKTTFVHGEDNPIYNRVCRQIWPYMIHYWYQNQDWLGCILYQPK